LIASVIARHRCEPTERAIGLNIKFLVLVIIAASLFVGSAYRGALAQAAPTEMIPEGAVFVFHSAAAGACPSLDWHVITGIKGNLGGIIAWDDMRSIARVRGHIALDRTFQMTAIEMGGAQRRAVIAGRVLPDGKMVADLKAPKIECHGIIATVWQPLPPTS
jgi:hypothetical protein